MNKVILMGRLTKDPEIRSTTDGKSVANFTLAVDRRAAKAQQSADFIRCIAWEKRAEFAEKYLKQGTKVVLTGRIQTGNYKDRDGKTVYTTDIVAEDLEFAESKRSQEAHEDPQEESELMPVSMDEDLPFN